MKMNRIEVIDRLMVLLSHVVCDTNLREYVTDADLVYIRNRASREGIEFLTIELPKLGKHLEACLQCSEWSPIEGFGKSKDSSMPKLLRTALLHIFEDGRPKCMPYTVCATDADVAVAIQAVRQVTLLFYKLEIEPTHAQVEQVIASFLETERELAEFVLDAGTDWRKSTMLSTARTLICSVVGSANPYDIIPRHGNGASACKTPPFYRWGKPRFSEDLNKVYPYCDYFVSQPSGWDESWLQEEPVHTELNARVAMVPKDSRGPRLISAEPREHMFIQQGLMSLLYDCIEHHLLAKDQVSCIDQSRNRNLAKFGSVTGMYATLDLKEASDKVSVQLVEHLFPKDWFTCLMACRSKSTILPDGRRIELNKFAPMGSACCFPVEALCFWAISLATIILARGISLKDYIRNHAKTTSDLEDWVNCSALSVFGDDIIVPSDLSSKVISNLEACGLTVNTSKSYTSGPFRESCGGDYYLGHDVGIVRCKHLPISETSVRGTTSWTARNKKTRERKYERYYAAAFRTRDFLNQVALRYLTFHNDRPYSIFKVLYPELPAIPLDYFTVVDPVTQVFRGNSTLSILANCHGTWSFEKKRIRGKTMYFTFSELSVDLEIDTPGWCWVLRALVVGSRDVKITGAPDRGHAGIVTLAKRHRYKYGWVRLNGV